MTKKHFIAVFIFAVIAAVCGVGAALYKSRVANISADGEPVFAATKAKMQYLGKIRIISADGNEINLYRQEGIWHLKEAKNYFANIGQLNKLLRMINDSYVISADETSSRQLKRRGLDSASGLLIETYALDDTILNRIILGKKTEKGICYARLPETEMTTYRISSCGVFSADIGDWVPYPLFSLPFYLLERIKTPETELYHAEIEEEILKSAKMRRFAMTLGAVGYQGIVYKKELPPEISAEETRQIEVELADGLVYVLTIYHLDDSYWLEVAMKVGRVARQEVPVFIEKNRKYIEDWAFQLDDEQGKLLFDFKG